MTGFAPIVIPTLNRHEHLKRCIESLLKCKHANETDIFIFLDYPSKENHWEGYNLIKDFLKSLKGFKSINIIYREKNYGVVDNFFKSIEYVFTLYDRLIFMEDDNEFSTDFLAFVNKGLEVFKNRDDIFSINGYNYPVDLGNYTKDTYIWKGISAWGMGLWKDKWKQINWDYDNIFSEVTKFLNNYKNVYSLSKIANHYPQAAITMLKKKSVLFDVYVSICIFQNNYYSVFPKISRVRNFGHDGSGTNCGFLEDNRYRHQNIFNSDKSYEMSINISSDKAVDKILYKHFKKTIKSRLKTFFKLILLNFKLYLHK